MTHDEDHDPEPPIVVQTIEQAQEMVRKVATLLQLDGWDSIVISLARAVETAPGEWHAPGATATVVDTTRCAPIMPQIAEVLRKQAVMLEEAAGGAQLESGYIQDTTDHASGRAKWPETGRPE